MINWTEFHFLRPWWLLLILVALVVFFLPMAVPRKKTSWERVIDPHLLPYLMRERVKPRRALGFSLWLFSFLSLVSFALAGPTLEKIPNDTAFYQAPVVICLEVSPHMLSRDINPSRLKRAIFKLEDLLRAYQGAEVSLIAFAGDAHVVVPLSNDYNTVMTMAKTLTPDMMPIKGVNLASAVHLAADVAKKNSRARVVVMTSTNFDDNALISQAPSFPITVWAFATDSGGPLELADGRFEQSKSGDITISKLRRDYLAKFSDTEIKTLLFTPDARDVDSIVRDLREATPTQTMREVFYDQWYDLGPYVLAIAMIVFLAALLFGRESIAFMVLFAIMMPSSPSEAGISDWFLRRDQQGQRALENKQPEKAAELFDDDFRKGTALYRARNYDDAIKHLSFVNTSDGQYNLGNALAQKAQYQEAIEAYKRALELNPNNSDAKANKELLERHQQQQDKQNKSQQQQDKNSSKEEEQKSSEEKSDEQNKDEHKQGKDQQQQPSSSPQEEKPSQGAEKKPQNEQKDKDGQGHNPETKEGAQPKKGEQPKENPLGEKLDPKTRYHFRQLEQKNDYFLKRKFLYESQKRQEKK